MRHQGWDKFVRPSFPETQVQQIKFTAVQQAHPLATTAETLLRAIPEAAIHPSAVLVPTPNHSGTYTFLDRFEELPLFDWAQLSFFSLSEDINASNNLALVIQRALLNDCPNINQEALCAVPPSQTRPA